VSVWPVDRAGLSRSILIRAPWRAQATAQTKSPILSPYSRNATRTRRRTPDRPRPCPRARPHDNTTFRPIFAFDRMLLLWRWAPAW